MDTDSFTVHLKTDDVYKDISEDFKKKQTDLYLQEKMKN